jgi:hypothetical protein
MTVICGLLLQGARWIWIEIEPTGNPFKEHKRRLNNGEVFKSDVEMRAYEQQSSFLMSLVAEKNKELEESATERSLTAQLALALLILAGLNIMIGWHAEQPTISLVIWSYLSAHPRARWIFVVVPFLIYTLVPIWYWFKTDSDRYIKHPVLAREQLAEILEKEQQRREEEQQLQLKMQNEKWERDNGDVPPPSTPATR